MVLEIELNPEAVKKLEKFVNTNTYRELAESAMSFNRKLNEERKMRIPYIDGQVKIILCPFSCTDCAVCTVETFRS